MGERTERAKQVADHAHDGPVRKGSDIPYATHPHAVALITAWYTDNEDAVCAAEPHDVLEDVPADRYPEADMRPDFGESVVEMVGMWQRPSADDAAELPWEERKVGHIEHLEPRRTAMC
ncbi:HD domain-containing protein [Gordonia sp. NPDC003376]